MKPATTRRPRQQHITLGSSRSRGEPQLTNKSKWFSAIGLVAALAVALAVWRFWPRDYSEQACRRNLAVLYVAAGRVVTGENPEPPPPVPNGAEEVPEVKPIPDLSAARPPAEEDVFAILVRGFWLTPDDNRYIARVSRAPLGEVRWSEHEPSAAELLCPKDPSYDEKSGYFSLARSWTRLTDLPPGTYDWNPNPGVLARCMRHHLELMCDGTIRKY
jgi:hypothetical protein